MQDLGLLAGALSNSGANGINDVGQVVGASASGQFVWTSTSGMEFLNPTQGYGLLAKINNHGQDQWQSRNNAPLRAAESRCLRDGERVLRRSRPGQDKAHFTFSAKYRPGASLPKGSAKLWIPGGRFDFESTAIEMLVVSGDRAQFWGTGT